MKTSYIFWPCFFWALCYSQHEWLNHNPETLKLERKTENPGLGLDKFFLPGVPIMPDNIPEAPQEPKNPTIRAMNNISPFAAMLLRLLLVILVALVLALLSPHWFAIVVVGLALFGCGVALFELCHWVIYGGGK